MKILWTAVFLIVSAGLWPPWATGVANIYLGYGFIFGSLGDRAHVDLTRLLVEWVIVSVVSAALFFAWPDALMSRRWPLLHEILDWFFGIVFCLWFIGFSVLLAVMPWVEAYKHNPHWSPGDVVAASLVGVVWAGFAIKSVWRMVVNSAGALDRKQ
jgi:hypothetical protein